MVKQLTVFLENSPGRLARLTRSLGDAGVNMRALMVADTAEFGVVRIICDRPEDAKSALEESGFSVSVTDVIAVAVPDRPGGLADILEVLGSEGMNVEYAYCFVEPGGETAVDVFRVERVADAMRVLEEAGIRVLRADEV
ncbi:MAG TPA: amino acid-binding protein [Coriobacteriia bacterium]|nr:MAG: Amino acid-binding ACT domain protein [Actinobacteria bacterium 66_15]HAL30512.1 amino acid-binding protein [Coriobacteriia bacterium]